MCPWLLSSHFSEVIGKIPSGKFFSYRGSKVRYLLPKENVCDAWHVVKCHCAYSTVAMETFPSLHVEEFYY